MMNEDPILRECEEGKARLALLLAKLEKQESQTEDPTQSSADFSKTPSSKEASINAK
ncbi:MAG: hypothetical protein ACYCPW_10760 [Nitrososphaerales archaeon]